MAGWCRRLAGHRVVLLAAGALAGTLVAGCGDDGDAPTGAARVVKVERVGRDRWAWARARFNEMCAGCHTLADARARGRRFNLDARADLNEELVRKTILGGGPGMPPFASSISYRELEQLTSYIMAVAKRQEGVDDYWQWQIRLRREGERDRPAGWPERRWLTVTRYNP